MGPKVESYEDLIAWQKAYALVIEVYEVSKTFPADERFGLTQQVRRAAVSVPSNIAEGWGRNTRSDYARFVDVARGSVYELQTQLKLAAGLGYLSQQHNVLQSVAEVERIINGLSNALKNNGRQ
jgi:four helix bundle protein